MKKVIEKFVDGAVGIVNKFLPDAFIFAALLTFVVFIFAAIVMFTYQNGSLNIMAKQSAYGTKAAADAAVAAAEAKVAAGTAVGTQVAYASFIGKFSALIFKGWYGGFWSLLGFSMEMALIIVTGSIFANTPQIKKVMTAIARIPKTPGQAVAIEAFFSIFVSFFQWGAALIMSAMLAKEIAKNVPGTHFALLVAAGYLGLGMWHGGFSGSIPLKLPQAAYVTGDATFGAIQIPFAYSLFAPFNLFNYVGGMIILPLVAWGLHPKGDKVVVCDPSVLADDDVKEVVVPRSEMKPNDKMNNSIIINYIMTAIGFIVIIIYFVVLWGHPFTLDIDFVNFLFLFLAMALFGKPSRLITAVNEAASGAAGVMLQFPFYGGISGLMTYDGGIAANNSLAEVVSNFFVSISNMTTYPLLTFLSAGLINFFIPSGGGQWAVQGPIVMPAAHKKVLVDIGEWNEATSTAKVVGGFAGLNAEEAETYKKYMGKSAMALAWGDSWTNLIQPFWALPLLAIAKLEAKDIMGYCVLDLIVLGIWVCIGFILL